MRILTAHNFDDIGCTCATALPRMTLTRRRKVVPGTHTVNDNGGPAVGNHCPARMVRIPTCRYVLDLSPETTFPTHITGRKKISRYWDSSLERAKKVNHAPRRLSRVGNTSKGTAVRYGKRFVGNEHSGRRSGVFPCAGRLVPIAASWCRSQNDS